MPSQPRRVLIAGAAGRDFHNFNVLYRENPGVEVVAFTATQIPNIDERRYPPELAGPRYPQGIAIHPEEDLEQLIADLQVDQVDFAYSDVSHAHVMHLAARVVAAGAAFSLAGSSTTMLPARRPVVSVCAVRTGCGKSQVSRALARELAGRGLHVVAVRHPMPYGDLVAQKVQRFATIEDLKRHHCTIEEMEEYEPHIRHGVVVYAGVDYGAILAEAEKEADVIVWDGGNNDLPFYRSDLEIVLVDPHRPGDETAYWPGEANLRRASVVVINKVGTARPEDVARVEATVREIRPQAQVLRFASQIDFEAEKLVGKRVLAIEDGPTCTHGGMPYGAAVLAARQAGAAELVDPRPHAQGSLKETYATYPQVGPLLPAMGYGEAQMRDLEATVRATPCDVVAIGTPIDLGRIIQFPQPSVRVTYQVDDAGRKELSALLDRFLQRTGTVPRSA